MPMTRRGQRDAVFTPSLAIGWGMDLVTWVRSKDQGSGRMFWSMVAAGDNAAKSILKALSLSWGWLIVWAADAVDGLADDAAGIASAGQEAHQFGA